MKHTVIPIVTALVQNSAGDYLSIKAPDPDRGWELPGGHVEQGEHLIDALRREVREESGVEITPGPLFGIYSNMSSNALVFAFMATYLSGELTTSSESLDVAWLPETQLLNTLHRPMILDRAKDGIANNGRVRYRVYTVNPYQIRHECDMDRPTV